MWQKCPICNGAGLDSNYNVCTVCKGEKILNTLTGKPPKNSENKSIKDFKEYPINKRPIYKGCNNEQCFCTGDCKKIIGFESFQLL